MCKNKMQQQNPNSTEIQSLQKAPRGWVCSSLNTEVINYSSCPCVGDTDLEQQIHAAAQDGWDRAPADHPACLVCVSECERERKVSCAGQLWVSRTDYGVFSGLNQSSYSPGEKLFLSVEVQWREGPLLFCCEAETRQRWQWSECTLGEKQHEFQAGLSHSHSCHITAHLGPHMEVNQIWEWLDFHVHRVLGGKIRADLIT